MIISQSLCGYYFYVHPRPGLCEFLDWIDSQGYEIVIFSAAVEEYVGAMVEKLFECRNKKPIHLLDSEFSSYTKKLVSVRNLFKDEKIAIAAVDDCKSNFFGDKEVIYVTPWLNRDSNDCEFFKIQPLIAELLK